MKQLVLDGYSINPGDISWKPLEDLGNFHCFDRIDPNKIIEVIGDADVIFISKYKITETIMKACPNLKFIGLLATGYDNVDVNAAKRHGIAVCNVPAYSTEAVAQHAFSMILSMSNHVSEYNHAIQNGQWFESPDFCFYNSSLTLLDGKSLGIVGYGNIGKRIAKIGEAFGMKINIYSKDKEATIKSDFLTLHCPATEENKGFINKSFISQMKDGAILINTARGALINEEDLANALKSGKLKGAALDVLSTEPPKNGHPLIGLPNCILTPHIAWAPPETRESLVETCAKNLESFLNGGNLNRIV